MNSWMISLLFNHSVVSDSFQPHGLQHTRHPCPSLSPGFCSNSCLSSRWYHLTISSFATPFSSWPQSFPASGSFPMSQFKSINSWVLSLLYGPILTSIHDYWKTIVFTIWTFFGPNHKIELNQGSYVHKFIRSSPWHIQIFHISFFDVPLISVYPLSPLAS